MIDASRGHQNSELVETIKAKIERNGIALLTNADLYSPEDLRPWADSLFDEQADYVGGTNKRKNLGKGILNVGTEPPHADIWDHNEKSYWSSYMDRIMFGCVQAPKTPAPTSVADNAAVTLELEGTTTATKIKEHQIRYIRNFHDIDAPWLRSADGKVLTSDNGTPIPECRGEADLRSVKSWQEAFNVENREQMLEYAKKHGLSLEWLEFKRLRVYHILPGYELDSQGNDHFFLSLGNHGLSMDKWAEMAHPNMVDRPFHFQYGNGEEFSDEDIEIIHAAFAKYRVAIQWENGLIAILDNVRWTHARLAYTLFPGDKRILGVALGNPVKDRRLRLDEH